MRFPRSSGILLHPTSLPGRFGIGDLGAEAHAFIDFLAETGQRWWQILPLGPTGAGNSPYQSHSSFAGNPLLIDLEGLVKQGWLKTSDLEGAPLFPADSVDFVGVAEFKERLLRHAFTAFDREAPDFVEFLDANGHWLADFSLYMAIKEVQEGLPWYDWDAELVRRQPSALAQWREDLSEEVLYHQFVQYVFESQWQELRQVCEAKGIKLIGDIPIFVAHDSADVWARPDLYYLDEAGRPTCVAGVPPDYFSETGQLWGNPLYLWEAHEKEGFAWWIDRIGSLLGRVDMIRIDHFRGFEAYWEVPGGAETAINGRWVPGPGSAFFRAIQSRFVSLPLIAEDLGVITPAVEALRDEFQLPGMRVLQFGFGADVAAEKHLPHRFEHHSVVYTGTHDNDTTRGWFTSTHVDTTQSPEEIQEERRYVLRYLDTDGSRIHWDMIRLALGSIADTSIIPLQDILGLDSRGRMNRPGRAEGNWGWRYQNELLDVSARDRLANLTAVFSRWNGTVPPSLDPHHRPGQSKSLDEPTAHDLKSHPVDTEGPKPNAIPVLPVEFGAKNEPEAPGFDGT